jgi:hypothetical protein
VQNARADTGRIEVLYDHNSSAAAFLLRAIGRWAGPPVVNLADSRKTPKIVIPEAAVRPAFP